ncbi:MULTISPECIES: Eco29kI family restriction endonuclease [Saccharothrix]|uniref:Eco29kI family restriction endonuclease n=1 Tax=Saccharothrix TaxID=2071 RepID=UPI00093B3AB1|nr:Eco29kI family restriction endonuclease [Saccharothrix sp. CB00851]OKI33143.1 restriction endonuclease [Saccharothrix sp. CB00851]
MTVEYQPDHFDPLSTPLLQDTICRHFERQEPRTLAAELPRFEGSGLYAIYYVGSGHYLYSPLSSLTIPVYVGQSASHNSATGRPVTNGVRRLWDRVNQHRRSIDACENLDVADFAVRLLRMPDVHANLGENGLRVEYQPVWNSILRGFGGHEQGSTTRTSARSKWDTLHPGRSRSYGSQPHDAAVLAEQVRRHIRRQIDTNSNITWHK